MSDELSDHVRENRRHWDDAAPQWVAGGERDWAKDSPEWGCWLIPESELQILPPDMTGMEAIELGCGTGYVSGWMARRGARVTGIDNSAEQLKTARRLSAEHEVELALLHGNAESVPCPDASFDFAISEYGAAIWCDPKLWIPEAHRLLRPGGQLVFLGTAPLALICTPLNGEPTSDKLHRDYFTLDKLDWREVEIDPGGVEFNLPISSWFQLFAETGFEILDYLELQAPERCTEDPFSVPAAWAKRFPSEQVWKLRKRL
jgi:SAM-dependent methyltransferase